MINLSPSIAITQNFVPEAHLTNVLHFLKSKPDQVSGFRGGIGKAYDVFVEKMRDLHPDVLHRALQEMDKMNEIKKRKWDQLINEDDEHGSKAKGFSFGFGDEENEDVP